MESLSPAHRNQSLMGEHETQKTTLVPFWWIQSCWIPENKKRNAWTWIPNNPSKRPHAQSPFDTKFQEDKSWKSKPEVETTLIHWIPRVDFGNGV